MCWNVKYIVLIAFSTIATYVGGILCEKSKKYKKIILILTLVINLLILFFFKYSNFFIENIEWILNCLNVQYTPVKFDVLLPVGISFYTFQALSYTIDVYRGTIKAEKNLFKYALFVSFFPQLVAGPIERSGHLIKQINDLEKKSRKELLDYDRIKHGFVLMMWGFFLKVVVADRIAILVDAVFDSYYMYNSVALVCAAIAFAIQIYCDFSSYSTIAIGSAQILGMELMENFDTPYFSCSIKEFWRRWHISLSTWFKDYLYIPLGGNRCSTLRKYFNLLVTFLVSGMWHGASWNYIVWGAMHGCYQIVGDITKKPRKALEKRLNVNTSVFSYKFGKMILTFIMVDIAWIFFRVKTFADGIEYIKRILTRVDLWSLFNQSCYTWGLDLREMNILLVSLLVLLCVDIIKYRKNERIDVCIMKQNLWFQWLVIGALIFSVVIFGVYGPTYGVSQFIYFQF